MAFQLKHVDSPDDVCKVLTEDGVVIMDNVLDAAQVATLHGILDEEIERDRKAGVLFNDSDDSNERLLDVASRHKAFRDLIEHPLSLDIASRWLKPRFRVSSFGANVTVPGSKTSFIHADQIYVPSPWPVYPLALNLMWPLDDYTKERGATHFLPGSHRETRGPNTTKVYPGTVQITCKAGSLILMDGRVWHHTGANSTADQKRAVLLLYLVNWFIIPQSDWPDLFAPAQRQELSPMLSELFGFGQKASMHIFEQFEGMTGLGGNSR